MKKIRLPLLLLALVVSFMATPEAFGAKKGGKLVPNQDKLAVDWWIDCGDGSPYIPCEGSYDYCRGYCDGACGGGPGSCA